MAIGWADIQDWDPADLNTTSENLSTARGTLMTEAQEASGAKSRVQSTGTAVDAMLTTLGSLNKDLDTLVNDVSELMMATSEASNGVWDVQTKVDECHSFAEQYSYLTIASDGTVDCTWVASVEVGDKAKKQADQDMAENSTRSQNYLELDVKIKDAINRAVEVDEAYRDRLKAVYDGTYQCDETSASESQGLPDLPQEGWSATEVSAWWNSLTEDERKKIIAEHPEAIGNLDGIAMADRAEANKNRLPGAIEDAQRELNDARERKNNSSSSLDPDQRTEVNNDIKSAEQKLKDLLALDRLVNKEGYNLLTLDASGAGEDVRAAVASGDVDNAANVVTMVPGISTTVRESMDEMLKNGDNLRDKAGSVNTATVAWLGYDAPRGIPVMDKDPNPNNSHTDYMTAERAEHAAPALNSFHEGIHSWHQSQGTDPNLTTVDHSYGSLVAGTALTSSKSGVVDAATLYGSPGAYGDSVHDFNVPEDHMYVSGNSGDFVVGMGPDAEFGPSPDQMDGMTPISSGSGGHSDYWNNPEFVEDVGQIAAGEDPSVDRVDDRSESAAEQE
jgi:uncharacterized protein rv0963c/MT0992